MRVRCQCFLLTEAFLGMKRHLEGAAAAAAAAAGGSRLWKVCGLTQGVGEMVWTERGQSGRDTCCAVLCCAVLCCAVLCCPWPLPCRVALLFANTLTVNTGKQGAVPVRCDAAVPCCACFIWQRISTTPDPALPSHPALTQQQQRTSQQQQQQPLRRWRLSMLLSWWAKCCGTPLLYPWSMESLPCMPLCGCPLKAARRRWVLVFYGRRLGARLGGRRGGLPGLAAWLCGLRWVLAGGCWLVGAGWWVGWVRQGCVQRAPTMAALSFMLW
jgi:hypothetical protein